MWTKKFNKIYKDAEKEKIWKAWSDVNNWPKWDSELKYCDMKDAFIEGAQFILKPVGGPKVKITLSEIVPNKKFTASCKFPGATMHNTHELEETPEGLKILNTITVTGPLTFLWANLVAKKVANAVPHQTDNLVEFVKLN